MPVDVEQLDRLLRESKSDYVERKFLVESSRNGFTLGYNGEKNVQRTTPNLKLDCGTKIGMWHKGGSLGKIMKEVSLGRYVGPFEQKPFDTYIQSPLGLVLKGSSDCHV